MTTRQEFLEHLWKEVINLYLRDAELDAIVSNDKRYPDQPFGDTGAAIERMLAGVFLSATYLSSFAMLPTMRFSARSTHSAIQA
jgi:hypothetical protein